METITKTKRFASLDVLRGLTVVGMILVNTQGIGKPFEFLRHSTWDGCTVADFVYPFFLFIVGAAIYFAFQKTNYELNSKVAFKILKRGALIFLIGFLINIFPFNGAPEHWRILGVLQRIAIVYVAATFLILGLKSIKKIAGVTAGILLGYWALIALTGTAVDNNIIGTVDRFLFGESHLYSILGVRFDPEGLISSIPAIANALFGYLTSAFLVREQANGKVPYRVALAGIAMILIAMAWNLIFPFNKPLWSSSFVLYTCGWAILIWFTMFWLIDVKEIKGWTGFFLVFGTNALFTYILSEILLMLNYLCPFTINGQTYLVHTWLDQYAFSMLGDSPLRPALWGVAMVLVCWAMTYPLYKKHIYIKL